MTIVDVVKYLMVGYGTGLVLGLLIGYVSSTINSITKG